MTAPESSVIVPCRLARYWAKLDVTNRTSKQVRSSRRLELLETMVSLLHRDLRKTCEAPSRGLQSRQKIETSSGHVIAERVRFSLARRDRTARSQKRMGKQLNRQLIDLVCGARISLPEKLSRVGDVNNRLLNRFMSNRRRKNLLCLGAIRS